MTVTVELLNALLSPDASHRSQAEVSYQSMTAADKVRGLSQQLVTLSYGESSNLEMLSAVLLRREILKIDESTMLEELVNVLLKHFISFPAVVLQLGHCLTAACFALQAIGPDKVSAVVSNILSTIEPFLSQLKIPALKLLSNIVDSSPIVVCQLSVIDSLPRLVQSIQTMNLSPQQLEALLELVVNASIAADTYERSSKNESSDASAHHPGAALQPSDAASKLGKEILPILLSHLVGCADEPAIQKCLEHASHAAVTCPSFLAGDCYSRELVLEVFSHLTLRYRTSTISLSALEVLVSLIAIDSVKQSIFLMPNQAQIFDKISATGLQACAHHMVHGVEDDVEGWAEEPASLLEDGDVNVDEDEALHAENLAELLVRYLDTHALQVALPLVQNLLTITAPSPAEAWKSQRAGLSLLESCLQGAPVSLQPHLQTVADASLQMITSSSNARIQWQATRLLGVLCETNGQIVREAHGALILERIAMMTTTQCTKLSSVASVALVSYCRGDLHDDDEFDADEVLLPYLSEVLGALIRGPLSNQGLDEGSITVRVKAMNAVACLAGSASLEFEPYYGMIMPGLLANAQLPSTELASAAVQAATIVGQAVGNEVFAPDAHKLLSWIIPVLQRSESNEQMALEELLSACARIATVVEEDFLPHIEVVLPHLLRLAQAPPDISVVEGNENDLEKSKHQSPFGHVADDGGGTESMTVALPGRGITKINVNTSKIQEKAQVIRAVYEHASALGALFGPYAESCFQTIAPLVKFKYSADVRSCAAQTLSAVFDTSCRHGEQVGMDVPRKYLPLLATSISEQLAAENPADMDGLFALADALSEIHYTAYRYLSQESGSALLGGFAPDLAYSVIRNCMKAMVGCLERRSKMRAVLADKFTGDDRRIETEGTMEMEGNVVTQLVHTVGYLLKFFTDKAVAVFDDNVAPVLSSMLSSYEDKNARCAAVTLYADCVGYCGPTAASKYARVLVDSATSIFESQVQDKLLLQTAVYGVTQVSRCAPRHEIASKSHIVVPSLLKIASIPKDQAGENEYLVEIAVSALAAMCLFTNQDQVNAGEKQGIIKLFLKQLPIAQDDDEAKICHTGFCKLVESGAIDMLDNTAQIIRVIGEVVALVNDGEDIATSEACSSFGKILLEIQTKAPAALQEAFPALSPDAQEAIQSLMDDC